MRSSMPISSQRASTFGSFCGRLAFMGKAVLGRFTVDFRSSGTRWFSPKWLIFHYRERAKGRPFTAEPGHGSLVSGGFANVVSKRENKQCTIFDESCFCRI